MTTKKATQTKEATPAQTLKAGIDLIAQHFTDMVNTGADADEKTGPVRNRMAWAQRDVIQGLCYKANSALDRRDGPVDRCNRLRRQAQELAETDKNDEFDHREASRIANGYQFWNTQVLMYEELLKAANDVLVAHGHEAYVRTDMSKPRTQAQDAPVEQAKLAGIFAEMGVNLPQETDAGA